MKLGFNVDDIDFEQRDKYVDMFVSEDGRLEQELNADYKNLILEKIANYSNAMHNTVKESVYEFSMLLYIAVNNDDEWEIVTDRLANRVKPTDILSSFENNLERLRAFAKQYYDLLSPINNASDNIIQLRQMVFKENNPVIVTQRIDDAELTYKFEKQIREELYKNLYYLLGEENVRPKIFISTDFSKN
jgi:deoxyadenosine/deoxycytidine kinase